MVEFIYMVPEIMNSNDRPNPTSWFWFNQWPNRSHLYTPGKPKAHISWLCEQNWNSKSRLGFLRSQSQIACELQNWKLWKTNQLNEMALVWCKTTQIRQFNENKIFPQRDLSNFGNLNFFPPMQLILEYILGIEMILIEASFRLNKVHYNNSVLEFSIQIDIQAQENKVRCRLFG